MNLRKRFSLQCGKGSDASVLERILTQCEPLDLGAKAKLWAREQPFDAWLLEISPLYLHSRKLYLQGGGRFVPVLVSSPRTLSSSILLEQSIQYSPVESEMRWVASSLPKKERAQRLFELRTWVGSLFHEQSHRLLWRMLPASDEKAASVRRYLNFVESLVVTADMALGDELGAALARPLYLSGTLYDPGTDVRKDCSSSRIYRNYLQATLYATYLCLEWYDPKDVVKLVEREFSALGSLASRAALRSCRLDARFIAQTNPEWQIKNKVEVKKALKLLKGDKILLPAGSGNSPVQYLWAEKWFNVLGL